MTREEFNLEIKKLTLTVIGIKDKLKLKMEAEGPDAIPPMIMVVLQHIDDLDELEDEEGRTIRQESVYLGVAINPEHKEEAIQDVIDEYPKLRAYGIIMHANAWMIDKDKFPHIKVESIEEAKKIAAKKDAMVTTIITSRGAKIASMESYVIGAGGTFTWTDEEIPDRGKWTGTMHNAYRLPLIGEEDFE